MHVLRLLIFRSLPMPISNCYKLNIDNIKAIEKGQAKDSTGRSCAMWMITFIPVEASDIRDRALCYNFFFIHCFILQKLGATILESYV